MKEFVSKLEEILPAEELTFPSTPAFGKFKNLMPEEAISHPAKFNTALVEYLILKYTKEGETILDAMAGTGVLGVIASIHGRNAIQVELEPKFYDWMEKARENVEKVHTLSRKGWIKNICDDARRLSELLAGFEPTAIVTSPPFGDQQSPKRGGGNIGFVRPSKDGKIGTDEKDKCWFVSENPENIANLPLGNIDAVITSPPYAEIYLGGGDVEKRKERLIKAGYDPKEFLGGKARNAVLKHYDEVDAVITSPPFGESNQYRGGTQNKKRMMKGNRPSFYSTNKKNIGNLPLGNINEKTKPTYLSEMFKIYKEMWKVLKENGLAIVAIKPFIRNKKIIDLPYYTYLLMNKAGFVLEKLYKLRLENMSFWRILYHKKFPNIPKIMHEYILVMRKVN